MRNETGRKSFDLAIQALKKSGSINASEARMFDKIRETRNSLVHTILKKQLTQDQIYGLLDDLLKKLLEAYRGSGFLDATLFSKYGIVRAPKIAFTPVPK